VGKLDVGVLIGAKLHTEGKLDSGTEPLSDKTIFMWFEEYSGSNPIPVIRLIMAE
jgi:hypothetical protein